MGFDTMRMNSGRCPPFLVAGLLIMCVLLTCNWWTLSTQNYDILKELEEMGEQLRKCSSQKSVCDSEHTILESRLKSAESVASTNQVKLTREISSLNEQINEKNTKIKDLETAREKSSGSLKTCESELEQIKQLDESRASVLAILRLEKTATEQQLQEQKDKVTELQKQLDQLKIKVNKPKVVESSPQAIISPNLASPELKEIEEEDGNNGAEVRFDISSETPEPQE